MQRTEIEEALSRWQRDAATVHNPKYWAETPARECDGTRSGWRYRAGPPHGWPRWRETTRNQSAVAHNSGWMPAAVNDNICFGTADKVRTHVDPFRAGLTTRQNEVKQCCRTELQSRAEDLDAVGTAATIIHDVRQAMYLHIDSTVALV